MLVTRWAECPCAASANALTEVSQYGGKEYPNASFSCYPISPPSLCPQPPPPSPPPSQIDRCERRCSQAKHLQKQEGNHWLGAREGKSHVGMHVLRRMAFVCRVLIFCDLMHTPDTADCTKATRLLSTTSVVAIVMTCRDLSISPQSKYTFEFHSRSLQSAVHKLQSQPAAHDQSAGPVAGQVTDRNR